REYGQAACPRSPAGPVTTRSSCGAPRPVSVGGLVFYCGTDRDGSNYQVRPFGDLGGAGGVRVTNGPGLDTTDLGGQNLTVGGAAVIQNGDGGSSSTLLAQVAGAHVPAHVGLIARRALANLRKLLRTDTPPQLA